MFLEKCFKLRERGTTVSNEILAGVTTFMTMAYILAVNPAILSQTGMDASAVFAATALSAALATTIMAFAANLPIALAPGMGLNAFFAFSVVLGMGYTWQFALTAVFLEGLLFILLTLTNLREKILLAIPPSTKKAISVGIGLFIAFIGLRNAGLVVANEATLLSLGSVTSATTHVALIGLVFTSVLLCYNVRGALLYGILGATFLGIPLGVTQLSILSDTAFFTVPSIAPTFLQLEWQDILSTDMLLLVITFLFVDLFDTLGTLLGLGARANLLDENGQLPKLKSAFMADALGTTFGALLGTSTVTTYLESTSGVAEGGKTGLTALTVATMMILSLFLAPLFLLIPQEATAPVLILVGLFMLSPVAEIRFNDYVSAIPAFLTLIMMPLTYSVATGIMWGIISHVILTICTKRFYDLTPLSVILAALFVWKLVVG